MRKIPILPFTLIFLFSCQEKPEHAYEFKTDKEHRYFDHYVRLEAAFGTNEIANNEALKSYTSWVKQYYADSMQVFTNWVGDVKAIHAVDDVANFEIEGYSDEKFIGIVTSKDSMYKKLSEISLTGQHYFVQFSGRCIGEPDISYELFPTLQQTIVLDSIHAIPVNER